MTLPPQQSLWRRIGSHPLLMHYNRLIFLVVMINLTIFGYGITQGWWTNSGDELNVLSNLVLVNISLAILIRQQYVINFLFWLATRAPTHWPLSIRWILGKVYHFGGLHVGGSVAGAFWFALFTGTITHHFVNDLPGVSFSRQPGK